MNTVHDVVSALEPKLTPEKRRAQAASTALEFEQIFVRSMVSTMRESAKVDLEEGGMFGSDAGSDTYGDWFDEHVATTVSENGRLGIASSLMREYDRTQALAKDPQNRSGSTTPTPKGLEAVDRSRLQQNRLPASAEGGLDVSA